MALPVRRLPAVALLAALLAAVGNVHPRPAAAQPDPKDEPKTAPEPRAKVPAKPELTADHVKALQEKFRAERAAAVAAKFPAEMLARPDEFAKRAEAALKAGELRSAARALRDARWQIPYLPAGLPPHVARVLGENRMRHADWVTAVAYSPDGGRLASSSRDGTVKVWDLGNGRDLVTYRGHADQADDPTRDANVLRIGDVAFSPDGKTVASVGGSQVHLWDPATGKQIKVLYTIEKSDKPLKAIAFRPDGKFLAVGGEDGILRVIEVETGKVTYTSPARPARIEQVAYSPNGKLVAVADSGGQLPGNVAVYAPDTQSVPMSGQVADSGEVLGVAFTADGSGVLSGGRDGKARLTAGPNPDGTPAPNMYTRVREFVGHDRAILALAASVDGKHLVTGGEDKTVKVWEVATGRAIRSFQGHTQKVVAVAVRPDGRQVASAGSDGGIRLWDLITADDHKALTEAGDALWAVAFSPDGKRLAAAGADRTIRVYDGETGKFEAALTGSGGPVTAIAFFPDGNRLASVGGDKLVRIWDAAGKKSVKELPGHEAAILAVAVSPDGKLLVSGAADRTVRGWDPAAGKQLWSWTGKSYICAVAVRGEGKLVAVGSADGGLAILDTSGGAAKEVFAQSVHGAGVAAAAFSPDGGRLATVGGDGILKLWAVADGGGLTLLGKLEPQVRGAGGGLAPLTGVAFSADGRFVAAVGADKTVRVWDAQTRAEARGFEAHTDWVTAVAFSPDGRFIASAGADKAVRVFELAPQESASPVGHLGGVVAVAVSPDGKVAATASKDQTAKLWDLATGRDLGTLVGGDDKPFCITFRGPDAVVVGGERDPGPNGRLHFWGTKPARQTKAVTTGMVYAVSPSADGSKVAAWVLRPEGDNLASTYEVYDKAGELVVSVKDAREAKDARDVRAVAFTPDLAWAVAGDKTGAVRIWNLDKKQVEGDDRPLFDGPVRDLGITPDKKLLVGVDDQGEVRVHELAARNTVAKVTAHKGGARGLVVSPTGDTFLTIGDDREVKLWSLKDPAAPQELRAWKLPAAANGAAYTPDGKTVVTANADGTAYVLELP